MNRFIKSDTFYLLAFFLIVIAVGVAFLCLPVSWSGTLQRTGGLPFIDALFTAVSAVCVTGLATVDTVGFSRFGQVVILLLIQTGGLGIFSFTSLLLIVPGRRLPFRRLRTIRSFSIEGVEHDPFKIVRNIIVLTVLIESLGAFALYPIFSEKGVPDSGFAALFHSISAFCNAGFSIFPDSMEGFKAEPLVLIVLSILIVTGGIGFIVLQDLAQWIRGKKKNLSFHTKLMLALTAVFIVVGAIFFGLIEGNNAFAGMSPLDRAVNALFQSITPRTAGFNAVPQTMLRQPSRFLTILLMFVGGAPGSIAGGVKIATSYIVLLVMLRQANERGEINAFGRRFSPSTINSAVVYFIKAVFLLISAAVILSIVEGPRGADFSQIVFEVTSAFSTVGLSLDLTKALSLPGKLVIIGTMFTGRVGLLAVMFLGGSTNDSHFVYPQADILLG